jgi:hypothetical protein
MAVDGNSSAHRLQRRYLEMIRNHFLEIATTLRYEVVQLSDFKVELPDHRNLKV